MITLWHAGRWGHSAAVMILLVELGLEYAQLEIDTDNFGQLSPDLLALNPTGMLPTLESDGQALTESFFILQYLDEAHGKNRLGGGDCRARYRVHKWGKYIETHIAPNLAILRWVRSDRRPIIPDADSLRALAPERSALWEKARRGFSTEDAGGARRALVDAAVRMAAELKPDGWLAGSSFTIADIAFFPHVAQFSHLGIEMPIVVQEWLQRMAARPSVLAIGGLQPAIATMGPEKGRWG